MSKYHHRADLVTREIVATLRGLGASVAYLDPGNGGIPDLCVGYRHANYLVEVKGAASVRKYPATQGRSPVQMDWQRKWVGHKPIVLKSMDEAVWWMKTL